MSLIQPSNREFRFFEKAFDIAQCSTYDGAKIGAVILKGNYIVSKGFNQYKSHTRQHYANINGKYDNWTERAQLHAETTALIRSGRCDLSNCEMFVARKDCHGNYAHSRPCRACYPAIRDAGIKHLYFTSPLGFHYERI